MISSIVTEGYGPGATIALVTTMGYAIGAAASTRVRTFVIG